MSHLSPEKTALRSLTLATTGAGRNVTEDIAQLELPCAKRAAILSDPPRPVATIPCADICCLRTGRMRMKRFLAVAVLAALSSAALAQQVKNPLSTSIREVLANRQKNILAAVDTMPADKFSYKPSADQMTFGHLVLHIIESNHHFCAQAADVPEPKVAEVKDTDGKDKLTAAL